jgi:hypothetical protein
MAQLLQKAEVWDGWGFVLYRQDYSDDTKWATALKRLEEYATAFSVYCINDKDDSPAIREKAKALYKMTIFEDRERFVDDDQMRAHFLEWTESGVVFSRPRFLAFSVADTESIESIATLPELTENATGAVHATIKAVDPAWDSQSKRH